MPEREREAGSGKMLHVGWRAQEAQGGGSPEYFSKSSQKDSHRKSALHKRAATRQEQNESGVLTVLPEGPGGHVHGAQEAHYSSSGNPF